MVQRLDPMRLGGPILCPQCGTSVSWRSRRRWPERILSLLNVYPYRCATCYGRYYAAGRFRQ